MRGRTAASGCAAAVLADRQLPNGLPATQRVVTSAADMGAGDYAALDLAARSRRPDFPEPGRLPDVVAAQLHGGSRSSRGCTPLPTVRRPNRGPPTTPVCGGFCGWTRTPAWPLRWAGPARALPRHHHVQTAHAVGCWTWNASAPQATGPANRRMDFARHLAAELAVNSWSDLLTVTTVGFGANCSTWHRTGPPDRPPY